MLTYISYLTILFAVGLAASKPGPPVVDLGYARYQGSLNPRTQNTEFFGIRFAAPPTGNLRWREPQPPQHQSGLQLANAHPPMCHQINVFNPRPAEGVSEDCLFLDVYVPGSSITPHKPRPVVVWIHGGAYALGSAFKPGTEGLGINGTYDGNDLILQSGGEVIVVNIQYRLGVFGFLSSEKVKRDGALNVGLLDQQFAFKWVQRHIAKFGGDPTKITIWGESAGAGSVLQHLIANGGKTRPSLFRGAMMSSSWLPPQYPYNHAIPEFYFNRTVELTGCSATPTLECVRAASLASLQLVNDRLLLEGAFSDFPFVPVVDGDFIKESPTRAYQKGRVNTNHILAVRNTRESNLVETSVPSLQAHINHMFPNLSTSDVEAAISLYSQSGTLVEQVNAVQGEAFLICPTYLISRSLKGQVFQGHFAVPPAIHGEDIRYYFPSFNPGAPPFPEPRFINTFAQVFMDFVLAQDPNKKHDHSSILPHWPRWASSQPVEMVFNRTGDVPDIAATPGSSALVKRCEFWARVASSTFQ